ncbi:MAG: hypothetical protein LBC98_02340 [Prevotellaceae bacterium]|jgi:hypothetical protein|nr:hypothetical protein [Prevotellaceae bacterium]
MFDFEKFLGDLILKNRRVIVPDLGAFLLTDTASRGKSIIFSTFLRYNDGFIESALKQKGISEHDSVKLLKDFVFNVNNTLNAGEEFRIANLGCFTKDDKGIQFLFDARDTNSQTVELHTEPSGASPFTTSLEKNSAPPPRVSRRVWVVASVVSAWAIIAAGIYFVLENSGESLKGQTADAIQQPVTATIVEPVASKMTESRKIEPEKQATSLMAAAQSLHYHVVVGCFAEKINSERFLQKCREIGFASAEILPQIGGLYPVSIEKFATFNEADRRKDDYIAQHDGEAWVYRTY